MSFFGFHPIIEKWFFRRFSGPTEPQLRGWPHIAAGTHTLISAPTGSGKTLTAFLACIDKLFKEAVNFTLPREMRIIYVSPLRALSNDMHRNLEQPLQEITALAKEEGFPIPAIRVGLRTGDTSSSQRASLIRRPPHILVTTPESLYLMLTSERGREALESVETVIIDEIHALIRDKRGSHLSLTLERLEALVPHALQRIGLSATQRPIETVAEFLIGKRDPQLRITEPGLPPQLFSPKQDNPGQCEIVNVGHGRELDLGIEIPDTELGAICTHDQWAEINTKIVQLVEQHRSTIIFVNTRRLAERVTHQLSEIMGEGVIGAHHGSLSSEKRLQTEHQLKTGNLKAVVATGSLELGLDIGYIDLVIQIGSPRSIATFLQRIGRSGHSLGLTPKGRLFALTRDELIEAMALVKGIQDGQLDTIIMPNAPLDILAQQIVAEVAGREWNPDELYALIRQAYPYRNLPRGEFDCILEYLSEGITNGTGRSRVYLHYDHVKQRVRARKGARIAAVTGGGAIPEIASYRVVAEPENTVVGTLDEHFAVESGAGDIFLLGNTSWRFLGIRGGDVRVMDAQGAPPTIPFWEGEAPGRTYELSQEISRLREEMDQRLDDPAGLEQWLMEVTHCTQPAASLVVDYAAAQKAAIGLLPTQKKVVFERFFDESGGMQLVVHAPFGSGITKAWGFAMRKRFCRSFDFELQATADDDGFILSLGPQHSFPIESLFPMLRRDNAQGLLEQAVLQVPIFQVRWRWNVTRSLLVMRSQNGRKIPPALQRFRADDLLTAVFPKLTGCQEEHTGDHIIPDHPLTQQTMRDCLNEALHLDGLHRVLEQIERGEIQLIARDTREPSPFSYELLNAAPYAFLDGGEAQERRARAVATRSSFTVESMDDLGRLDAQAIQQVLEESSPFVRDADELHDLLLSRISIASNEEPRWVPEYRQLERDGRATTITLPDQRPAWVATERLPAALAIFPEGNPSPPVVVPKSIKQDWEAVDARVAMVRGLLETCGPITAEQLAQRTGITTSQADAALEALEGEGMVLRGHFTPANYVGRESSAVEWCHRRLLARIHRLTLDGLRRQIEPVSVDVFQQFLFQHHGLLGNDKRSGANGLFEVIAMLQGIDIPALSWETDILPARLGNYSITWLDELCLNGEIGWGRLYPPPKKADNGKPMSSLTRIVPVSIWLRTDLPWLLPTIDHPDPQTLSSAANDLVEILNRQGAMFASDLLGQTRLLPTHLYEALGELITRGLLTADGFSGLRQLIARKGKDSQSTAKSRPGRLRERTQPAGIGRWSLWRRPENPQGCEDAPAPQINWSDEQLEQWAWQLLRRWGVMFRDLLTKEAGAPPWFDLVRTYRRLEARGEIRGGRFITGVGGEQFALSECVKQLRQLRDELQNSRPNEPLVTISGADPLNLVGVLTSHPRVPCTASNQVAYYCGRPVASMIGGEVRYFTDLPAELLPKIAEKFRSPQAKNDSAAMPKLKPKTEPPRLRYRF